MLICPRPFVLQGVNCSSIGDATHVGDKISIMHSTIGKRCKIGDKVKIINSVILNDVNIEDRLVFFISVVMKQVYVVLNPSSREHWNCAFFRRLVIGQLCFEFA